MFSSKIKEPTPTLPSLTSVQPLNVMKKAALKGTVPSIVSADLTVTGTLISNGDIQIDGVVEGDVRSVGLVIGEKAQIHGEVLAEDVTVRGKVFGRIRARKVQLAATAHVEGDILHEAFSVEAGAFFEGNCRHSDNPLGDEIKRPAVQAVPTTQSILGVTRTGLAGLVPVGQPAE
jgi:cytoskeletal protein CcmA (bactofilin family)